MRKNRLPFVFQESEDSFLYQKKDIILENEEDFIFSDFFSFIGTQTSSYKYRFEQGNLIVIFNEQEFIFPYIIKEREKEIVEKYIVKEVYKDKEDPSLIYSKPVNNPASKPFFSVKKDYFTFSEGTDLSTIIEALGKAVDSSEKVVIDYSSLNPNEKGTYLVFFSTASNSAQVTVEIQ